MAGGLIRAGLAGTALLWRRPWLLPIWTLIGWPTAAAFTAGWWLLGAQASPYWGGLGIAGVMLTRPINAIQEASAIRAELRPDDARVLAFGAAERRLTFLGLGRSPGAWPVEAILVMAGLFVALGIVVALAMAFLPTFLSLMALVMAFIVWMLGLLVVGLRSGMASIAAYLDREGAQTTGWDRGRGRTAELVAQGVLTGVPYALGAASAAAVWVAASRAIGGPSLEAFQWPVEPQGGGLLVAKLALTSFVLSLTGALWTALRTTAMARTWRLLSASDPVHDRRMLFGVA